MTPTHQAILDRGALLEWRRHLRTQGQRLVQCHGCFDIVHPGHVRHLRWAKAQGDALLVTITADHGIHKGPGRPLIPHDLRAENLASLDMVDAVHVVHEPTAEAILKAVQPDIYVKGREYESNNDPRFAAERDAVQAAGGRVVFSSGDIVFSSSALIAALESGRDTGVDASTGVLAQLLRRPGLTPADLLHALDAARGARVLVVGEAIEETYTICQAPQLAAREPVMTLRPAGRHAYDAGAAGLALQLAAMGLRPTLLTCPPKGPPGKALAQRLEHAGVALAPLPPTPEPLRVEHFLAGTHKLMTVDHAQPIAADTSLSADVATAVAALAPEARAVCVADQGLGLLAPTTARVLSEALRDRPILRIAGAHARNANPLAFRHAHLLCLGEPDLRRATANPAGSLTAAAWSAMDAAQARAAILALGPEGLLAFDRLPEALDTGTGWPTRVRAQPVPSLASTTIDPTGADAALLAAATVAMIGAHDSPHAPVLAALLGALAEADALARTGHAIVTHEHLHAAIARLDRAHLVYRGTRHALPLAAS